MKLGVSQSLAQSDATNIIPCLGVGDVHHGCRIMPVNVQRQVPSPQMNFLIFHVNVDSDPEAAFMEFHGSSHLEI